MGAGRRSPLAEHDAYLNSEGVGGKALYLTSRERVVHHTQIVAGGASRQRPRSAPLSWWITSTGRASR